MRADLHGDWSDFSGQINATTAGSAADVRFDIDYGNPGLPSAALNLGPNVNAYWSGNLNSGNGSTMTIGELTGSSSATLRGGSIGGRQLTYRIGGRGTDFTFAGAIGEQTATMLTNLVKTGAGMWTLSGTLNLNGKTTVEAGTLRLTGNFTTPAANPLEIMDGAVLDLPGATVNASIQIADGATLTGAGTINGSVTNDGALGIGGGTLNITGDFVNNGTAIFTGGAALQVGGTFTNNGFLDVMTGAQTLPANFINNGIVLDRSLVKVAGIARSGANFTVTIQGYAGHAYQLQRADTLAGPWTSIGASQPGADSVLTFTDTGGATGAQRFYRIAVGP